MVKAMAEMPSPPESMYAEVARWQQHAAPVLW